MPVYVITPLTIDEAFELVRKRTKEQRELMANTIPSSELCKSLRRTLGQEYLRHPLGIAFGLILKELTGEGNLTDTSFDMIAPMTFIVPLDRINGHNYTLDQPFLNIEHASSKTASSGIRISGSNGNSFRGNFRYASDDEVLWYKTHAEGNALSYIRDHVLHCLSNHSSLFT